MIDIKSLQEGDHIDGLLAIRSMDGPGEGLKDYSNKSGRFFVIKAGNRTGNVLVKYWGGKNPEKTTELYSSLKAGEVFEIKGKCIHDSYTKTLVISVNENVNYGSPPETINPAETGLYTPADFIPALPAEVIESHHKTLKEYIDSIKNPHLKSLLNLFFSDPKVVESFRNTPAARGNHHNYIGGLLEHSVNVAKLCETQCTVYPLDRDLLITGAILHDFGKTREYTLKASIDVSDEGRLVGHLPMTAEMVKKNIDTVKDFPEKLSNKLIHIILSHHGQLEYGSPKVPMFPEALALHHADHMDADVKNMLQEIESDVSEEAWTYSRLLRRYVYKS